MFSEVFYLSFTGQDVTNDMADVTETPSFSKSSLPQQVLSAFLTVFEFIFTYVVCSLTYAYPSTYHRTEKHDFDNRKI